MPEPQLPTTASSVPELFYRDDQGEFQRLELEPALMPEGAEDGGVLIHFSQTRQHVGPVPSPQTLSEYDQLCPGVAAKVLEDHLEDKKHIREMAHREVDLKIRQIENEKWGVIRGQAASFTLMALAIGASVFCASQGWTVVAAVLGSAPVLTALGRFLGHPPKPPEKSGD